MLSQNIIINSRDIFYYPQYGLELILLTLLILTETTKVTTASSKKDDSLVDKNKNPALRTFKCAYCKCQFYSEYYLEKHCALKHKAQLGDKNQENPKGEYYWIFVYIHMVQQNLKATLGDAMQVYSQFV